MAVLVPGAEANKNSVARMKTDLAQTLMDIVRDANQGMDIIYRPLLVTDLLNGTVTGRANNQVALTANTLATDTFANFTLTATQALGIYGFTAMAANPLIDEVDFQAGSALTLAKIHLDEIYGHIQPTMGYIVDPIIWQPLEHVNISLLAGSAVSINAESFALLGYLAEQAGKNVVPPRALTARQGTARLAR